LIADTSGLLAAYDRRAAEHQAIAALLKASPKPTEIDYLLRVRLGIAAELRLIEAFQSGAFRLEAFHGADWERCRQLVSTYSELDLGLADSGVIAAAERLQDRQILTLDERHFRVVESRLGFLQLLPADA